MSSAEPEFIGKYEVLGRIAQGGMAEIFLARQPGIGGFSRRVVLKCILPLLARETRFVKMFMEEARLASMIHHPNVVQIFDVGEDEGTYFIAMEFIDGLSVGSMLVDLDGDPCPVPIAVAGEIVAQACAGLHAAHKLCGEDGKPLGIVHRDVSPQNLMVSGDGVVKLVDFGIAKAQDSSVTTRTGNIKGKYAYMSPEQVRGLPLDRRSDVFSLGTVFYELLTGKRLFHRNAELAILMAIIEEPFPSAHEVNPSIPRELSDIIGKALERDREKRFSTTAELGMALRQVLGTLGHYTSPETLAKFVDESCKDQLGAREVEQLGLRTPGSRSVSLNAVLTPVEEPSAEIPEIIDLPPPRVERREEAGRVKEEVLTPGGDASLDEPTVQSMQPLRQGRAPASGQRRGQLPEPAFIDDFPPGLGEAPTLLGPASSGDAPAPRDNEPPGLEEPTVTLQPLAKTLVLDFQEVHRAAENLSVTAPAPLVEAEETSAGWVEIAPRGELPGLLSRSAQYGADRESSPASAAEPAAEGARLRDPVEPGGGADEPPLELEQDQDSGSPAVAEQPEPARAPRPPSADEAAKPAAVQQRTRVLPIVAVAIVTAVVVSLAGYFIHSSSGGRPPGPPLVYAHPPSYPLETLQQGLAPLATYLEQRMKRPVDIGSAPDYSALVDRLLDGQIHFANLPPLLFVLARDRDPDLEALAMIVYEGSNTDQSYLVARDDSGIRSVDQLKGRSFCYPDRRSTTGYLMPRRFLRSRGSDPDQFFSKAIFSKGHVGVMEDIISGRCDAGAVISSAWLSARDLGIKGQRIRLVAVAGDVMRDVVCASPKLSTSLTESLRGALLELNPQRDLGTEAVSPLFPIERFVKVNYDGFSVIEEAAREEKLID